MASGVIKSKFKSLALTNFATTSDGFLAIDLPRNITLLPSRLLDDNSGHLLVPFGASISASGLVLYALLDNTTKAAIAVGTSVSGTLNYSI